MAKQILSGKYFLLTVFFFVFTFFISINSYGGVSMPTDFLDECASGLSANGCCIADDIDLGQDCTVPNVFDNNIDCTCEDPENSGVVFVEDRILYIFGTSGLDEIQVNENGGDPDLELVIIFDKNGDNVLVEMSILKDDIDSVVVVVCDDNDIVEMGSGTRPTLIEGGGG